MKTSMLTMISLLLAGSLSAQVNFNNNTVSAANYSSALGEDNVSNGMSSFAGGLSSQSTGNQSFGFGYLTLSNGLHSVAMGSESKATQNYGIAMGRHAYSTNVNAIAIGKYADADGVSSFSLGTFLTNSAGFSFLIGNGAGFSERLTNSIDNSLIIGFNSTVPTLFIGPSGGANISGKVGIGNITAPTAKLHIKADDNENASLKLEPTGSGYEAQILMGDDLHKIVAKPNDDLKFSIPSGRNFVFENGKVKTTGFQLTDGQQSEGKYLRSDASGNASWATSNVPCLDCLASGQYASTIGMYDTATGMASIAAGLYANAFGTASVALGKYVTAEGAGAVTIGRYLRTATSPAFIIGTGANIDNYLVNSISNSLMIGFNSVKPTLFVGGAMGNGYTGKIGIGDVTEPQAKLHIKGDQYEQASLFIEPYVFGGEYDAELWMGTEDYGMRAAYGKMYFNTGGNYIFNSADANVGIGTLNPLAKLQVNGDVFIEDENSGLILKSPDGQCWKITVNNSGELTTTSINCNLTTAYTTSIQPAKETIRIYPNPTKDMITIENNYTVPVFVTLRDLNGVLITTQKLQPGDNKLNLHELVAGYYVVTIMDNNNQVITSEKIMKK